jgi:type IV fimbrial biogenesis protein FimT
LAPLVPTAPPSIGNWLAIKGKPVYGAIAQVQGEKGMQSKMRPRAQFMRSAMTAPRGFTLIELMVTVAVLAIIIALATPSFTSVINSNRLSSHANELVASLQLARMEAVRRNVRAVVCRSENGSTCATGAPWNGWITFVDTNRNGTAEAAELLRVNTVKAPVQVRPGAAVTASRIVFLPDGLARVTDSTGKPQTALLSEDIGVCIETKLPPENQRLVHIRAGSRISVERSDAGGKCATPATPAQ